jgi:hypothetical protein
MRIIILKPWQTATLIALQLLFAACATSVLVYRARGWAPQVFDFGWLSYRALNIYISLALIGYLVWGLLRGYRHALPLLAVFSLFHLVEGVIIGFLSKALIHLITLIVIAWVVSDRSVRRLPGSSIERERGEIGAAE